MSIGIALSGPDKTADDLLRDADVAMYRTKDRGRRGQYEVFDAEVMGIRSAERIELETELRQALDRGELEVHFQPLYSLAERTVVGAEALVRWRHPRRGLLGPGRLHRAGRGDRAHPAARPLRPRARLPPGARLARSGSAPGWWWA